MVRRGEFVRLCPETALGPNAPEWVIYNEFTSDGNTKKFLKLVTPIARKLLLSTQPGYWSDEEFIPEGHIIRDNLVEAIARMTNNTHEAIRGSMPSKATTASST